MNMNYDPKKVREMMTEMSAVPTVDFWRPPEGESVIRILPPITPTGLPYYRFYSHYLEDKGNVRCRKSISRDESCPICEWITEHARDPELKAIVSSLAPILRYAVNIVVRGDEPLHPKIWTFGTMIANALSTYFADEEYIVKDAQGNVYDLLDPKFGRDFKITRTGQGLATRYQIVAKPNISSLHENEAEIERILNERYNLQEVLRIPELEEVSTTFFTWIQSKINMSTDEDIPF